MAYGALLGGNNVADVQRLTIVADPANANGSAFGGIRMGNAIFAGGSGGVGIAATNVQVQNVVVLGDINTSGTAIPTLTFGSSSQFGSPRIAGGDLQNTNIGNFSGFSSVEYIAGTDSAGRVIPPSLRTLPRHHASRSPTSPSQMMVAARTRSR